MAELDGALSSLPHGRATWIVVRRALPAPLSTGEHLYGTLVMREHDGAMLAAHIDTDPLASLRTAFMKAATEPALRERPKLPARCAAAEELVPELQRLLGDADVAVFAAVPGDDVEDIADSFVSHMMGRRQPRNPPTSNDWRLFYGLAERFVDRAAWQRWDDTVHLRLWLKLGSQRSVGTAIVQGNAEISRGLVLLPTHDVRPEMFDDGRRFQTGTVSLTADPRAEVPEDVAARAERYGWSHHSELVGFCFVVVSDGVQEPAQDDLQRMTIAIAATLKLDEAGPAVQPDAPRQIDGELTLGDGRPATYRLEVITPADDSATAEEPETVRFTAAPVEQDLLPEGTRVRVAGLPWELADRLRAKARLYAPSVPPLPRDGPSLPAVMLSVDEGGAEALQQCLEEHLPEGITVVSHGTRELMALLCRDAVYLLMALPHGEPNAVRFVRAVRENHGGHTLVVMRQGDDGLEPPGTVLARYDFVLLQPPLASRPTARRRPGKAAQRRTPRKKR